MKDRIKEIRNNQGMSQTDFAKRLLVSRSAVCKMESGENSPSDQTINLICREFNVNEDWLRTGRGEMFKKRSKSQEIGYFANEIMDLPDENFKKRFISALAKLNEKDWEVLMKIADELNKEG